MPCSDEEHERGKVRAVGPSPRRPRRVLQPCHGHLAPLASGVVSMQLVFSVQILPALPFQRSTEPPEQQVGH